MNKTFRLAALTTAMLATTSAYATNGYFLPGFGFRAQGMGGVGIAFGRDSLSTAANPANAVNTGMRGDLGMGIFNPERSAAVGSGAGNVSGNGFNGNEESDTKYFLVPEMGFSMPLDDKWHVALAVVGNGGMNTTFRENFFTASTSNSPQGNAARNKTVGVDLIQLLVPVTLAYKVNDDHAVGVSLVGAMTRFRAYGLDTFGNFNISNDANHLTNQGFDYSYGGAIKLGWQGEFFDDRMTLGLAYMSRGYMTKFDKYRGLFAEGGDFDIPQNFGIGIALKPVNNLTIAADVFRIMFNQVNSVGNPGPGLGSNNIPALADSRFLLGLKEGMGFGWRNQTVYKLGVEYGMNERLKVRGGVNYGESPLPKNQLTFNTLAPATVEWHLSTGFTYKANDNLEVTGTYMHVFNNAQSASNQNIVNDVRLSMHQNLFALSLGWILDPGPKALGEYGTDNWDGINFDGWYGGLNVGQSHYRDVDLDTSNTRTEGWKAYAGYEFNKYLAMEGGYVNLNDYEGQRGSTRVEVDTDGWFLEAVGSYPITKKLAVTGKVGGAYLLADSFTTPAGQRQIRSGEDELGLTYGAGVKYALLDNVDARLEWDRYDRDSHNIDLVSAGLAVKF